MITLLLSAAAFAQAPSDWILDKVNPVLEPDLSGALPWMEKSVGAPSIMFDTKRNRFLMVFESRILDPVDGALVGCPQGVWGLGLADSPDGVTWTPRLSPLIEPQPGDGTYFSCVAAHPTAVFEQGPGNGNGGFVAWFKTEQDEAAQATCNTPQEPSWGCGQYTGVGRVRVTFNNSGNITNTSIKGTPSITSQLIPSIGYPKVFKKGNTYTMLVAFYPDIWMSTSTASHDAWVAPVPVMEVADYQGAITWVRDEFFNPSSVCADSVTFPLAAFPGGRFTGAGGVVESGGWGKAISTTGTSWVLGVDPQQEWTGDSEWRHWDILRLVTGDYLVWFDQTDVGSSPKVNRIYFGGTTATFNNTDVQNKVCP